MTQSHGALRVSRRRRPVLTCTANDLVDAVLTWAAVPDATGYTLYADGDQIPFTATAQRRYVTDDAAGTARVVAHRTFPSPATATWDSAQSNGWTYENYKVLSILPVASTCTAVA